MLNGRVRNGNGCGHPGLLTGKMSAAGGLAGLCQAAGGHINKAAVGVARFSDLGNGPEERINAAKRSAISTG